MTTKTTVIGMLVGASLLLAGHAAAQSGSFSPTQGVLRGQAVEESMARAQREGEESRQRQALYRAIDAMPEGQEKDAAMRRYLGWAPEIRRTPTVTNPYSPYLGLPTDLAEGQLQQQILELNEKIDRLERQRR